MLFDELDATVKKLTGSEIKIKVIHGSGLSVILTDYEVAEDQGAGDWLAAKNRALPTTPLQVFDPLILIQYVLKLCRTHGQRCASSPDSRTTCRLIIFAAALRNSRRPYLKK